ncbi:MAG: hypothetical protein WCG08_13040 [Paludibacter sp.]|jgi:hypothetical protein
MKNLKLLSTIFQVLVLLCFFLPFFPQGCEKKKADTPPASEQIGSKLIQSDKKTEVEKTTKSPYDSNRKALSEKLSNKSKLFKFLLRPDNDYTGIGYSLDMLESLFGFGVAFSLILWIIGLVVKLKDNNSILHVINISGLVLFFFTEPAMFTDTKLWGYWVCLSVATCMVLYDLVLVFVQKRRLV